MEPSKQDKKEKIINLTAFFALAIIALLIVIDNFFPFIGITMSGTLVSILRTLQSVLIILTLGIAAFNFVKDKKKGWKITYWVIIAIFVAAITFIWLNNNK